MNSSISGKLFRDAVISASNVLSDKKKTVDELNVFPVPDGDTGTNMSMTISNAALALKTLPDSVSAGKAAAEAASGMLRGARGNSGVILSLIFRGFSKALADKEEIDAELLVESLELGVKGAYKSVMKPTEGTILTVAREAAEKAREVSISSNDPLLIWDEVCRQAEITLEKTPDLLPQLAKAGVVDAGGKGLVIVFNEMKRIFAGGEIAAAKSQDEKRITVDTFADAVGLYDDEIHFTYCTEMLITKDENCDSSDALRAYLETIGDCVVVVEDDEIIKVHVHTNDPGLAIQKGLEFGIINLPKVENMKLQHESRKKNTEQGFTPAKPEKKYGFVAVAAGSGIEAMFTDIGVDCVVRGGQTMNPSTDDILKAVMSCPAETVFVLPNNKNIIMAAEQAMKLADRRVCVLQTRSIPQGMSAMMAFDPEADFNTNRLEMTNAFERVSTGQVTFAARDSDFEGHSIKQGEILCMENGRLCFTEKDVTKGAYKLTKRLVKGDTSFITILYGADVTDEAAENLYAMLSKKFSNLDINMMRGGQPVYYYIISAE
ncbi:MAG: DAK2 domain-containing protein [Oscillospiraceae bacterium]